MWEVLSLTIPPFAVLIAIGFQVSRSGTLSLGDFRVLAAILSSIFVMSFGQLLESVAWIALNQSLALAWTLAIAVMFEDCLCMLRRGVQFALLPGTAAGIAIWRASTLRDRFIAGWLAATAVFLVYDTSHFLTLGGSATRFLFSLASNIAGGALSALIVASVVHTTFQLLDGAGARLLGARHWFGHTLRVAAVLSFLIVLLATSWYFIFVHQLPVPIDLVLDNWTALTLRYALREIADPIWQDDLLLPVTGDFAGFPARGGEAVVALRSLNPGPSAVNPQLHVRVVKHLQAGEGESLAQRNESVADRWVPIGDLRIRGASPKLIFGQRGKEPSQIRIGVKRGELISFQKQHRIVNLDGDQTSMATVVVRSRQVSLAGETDREFSVMSRVTMDTSPSGQPHEIYLPGQLEPISITGGRCCAPQASIWINGPPMRIEFHDPDDEVEVYNAGLDPAIATSRTNVTELWVSRPSGKLSRGDDVRTLDASSETANTLFITGDGLRFQGAETNQLRVIGQGRLVSVNDRLLSHSIWSSMSVEIQAVILGAGLACCGWLVKVALTRKRVRAGVDPS